MTEEEKKEYSPMMQHYFDVKEKYNDCIVFYRLGDFYEMFFEDAIKASAILDLTLTGRDCGKGRAPMCGVPYHAADQYIAKLVEKGEQVAICEQLQDPKEAKEAKQIVERDVVRIVTAGTITEESLIDEKKNNYIACVYYNGVDCAYAWCDITTGQFFVRECDKSDKLAELSDGLVRISPSEIVANGRAKEVSEDLAIVKHFVVPSFKRREDGDFFFGKAERTLKEQFGVKSLDGYGISAKKPLVIACGALISYLRETQKHALMNISGVRLEKNSEYMWLDANALRNLEIIKNMRDGKSYGTLLHTLDKTETAMGARLLTEWLLTPLQDVEKIRYRQDGVEELLGSTALRGELTERFQFIRDAERLAGKVSNGNAGPRDCRLLGETLCAFSNIKMTLFGVKSKILNDVNDNITDLSELGDLLVRAFDAKAPKENGGYISDNFDPELDKQRNFRKNSEDTLKEIEERERQETGIKTLKIGYNRVFGYYIEVTNSFKDQVPYSYVRKQTLTGGERYITEELKNLEQEILESSEKAAKLEAEIFAKLKSAIKDRLREILRSSRSVACLDVLLSFAKVAKKNDYCRPEVKEDGPMSIVGGRHPVVEDLSGTPFIPNDLYLDDGDNEIMIITGPNMAGKSTYMRQNAIIAIMAHVGSFVPAKSAEIPIIDRVFTRVGASDNLIFDQSTFMVEMSEVAEILLGATSKSLLILDEVGRGTSTFDGLSIAWAVVEHIAKNIRAKTLFATHYHELSELEGVLDGVKNYKITVKELNGNIVFLRKIARGSVNRSFGIEVAGLAGIPKSVTARAKEILSGLEKNDYAKKTEYAFTESEETENKSSEIEDAIREIDINSLTPLDALKLLYELKEKIG